MNEQGRASSHCCLPERGKSLMRRGGNSPVSAAGTSVQRQTDECRCRHQRNCMIYD